MSDFLRNNITFEGTDACLWSGALKDVPLCHGSLGCSPSLTLIFACTFILFVPWGNLTFTVSFSYDIVRMSHKLRILDIELTTSWLLSACKVYKAHTIYAHKQDIDKAWKIWERSRIKTRITHTETQGLVIIRDKSTN